MSDPIETARTEDVDALWDYLYEVCSRDGNPRSVAVRITAAVRSAAIAETEARYRGLVEAARKFYEWHRTDIADYDAKYGDRYEVDVGQLLDNLDAALRAIEGDTNG